MVGKRATSRSFGPFIASSTLGASPAGSPSASTFISPVSKVSDTLEPPRLSGSATTSPFTGAVTSCVWPAKPKAPDFPTWMRTSLVPASTANVRGAAAAGSADSTARRTTSAR